MGLSRMQAVLAALGNPEQHMRHIVVAGTNGKGFTSSLTARMLQKAGYKVGLFTSPHLLRFTERIRINGEEISQDDVVRLFGDLQKFTEPSFFECATIMALLAFSEQKVDFAVMEVGLGGRLDATNVVPKTLSVITAVGMDHELFLGTTIEQIAFEKASIIAPHGTVVLAPQLPEAAQTIGHMARANEARIINVPRILDAPAPIFQQQNIATVATIHHALRTLGIHCPNSALDEATQDFTWTGRYQWADPVLFDGAHNLLGMQALIESLNADPRFQRKQAHVVFTALKDKPVEKMLSMLSDHTVYLCPTSSERSRSVKELEDLVALVPNAQVFASSIDAFEQAKNARGPDDFVLVSGSLFLVADILAYHLQLPRDPAIDS
jgi:dihydrofolate synthase / folylpolyglutamate synthase